MCQYSTILDTRPIAEGLATVDGSDQRGSSTVPFALEEKHRGDVRAVGSARVALNRVRVVGQANAPECSHAVPLVAPLLDEHGDCCSLLSEEDRKSTRLNSSHVEI